MLSTGSTLTFRRVRGRCSMQVSAFDIAKACFEWVRYYVDHSFDFRKNPVM